MAKQSNLSAGEYAELKDRADSAARSVALLVFFVSLLLLFVGFGISAHYPSSPASVVTVKQETTRGLPATVVASTSGPTPGLSGPTTSKTTTASTDVATRTTTTTPGADLSFTGRALENPAVMWILALLAAILASFLAGAAVQRMKMGEYGITVAGITIPSLPPVTVAELLPPKSAVGTPPREAALRMIESDASPAVTPTRASNLRARFELERAIRHSAQRVDLDPEQDPLSLLFELTQASKLDGTTALEASRLLAAGDKLADGADITPTASALYAVQSRQAIEAISAIKP